MTDTAATFIAKSTIKASDTAHRGKINFNISKYNAVVPAGKLQFTDVMLARERAKNAKWRAIETLDHNSKMYPFGLKLLQQIFYHLLLMNKITRPH